VGFIRDDFKLVVAFVRGEAQRLEVQEMGFIRMTSRGE
jgi:hypothetical protein